jgi:16S rRNA (cytosine1402-N4)-methyltransferase
MPAEMNHVPVLLTETLKYLNVSRFREQDGVFVDATFGGGGHSMAILDHTGQGLRLIAIDRDRAASQRAISLSQRYGERFTLLQGNFADLSQLLDEVQVKGIDALLLDLGLSSYQLSNAPRGFSFQLDGPLDMRMDQGQESSAADIIRTGTVDQLRDIFRRFGEEPYAGSIARAIVAARSQKTIITTRELADLILSLTPPAKSHRRLHPATRVFQALRIAVNEELQALVAVLEAGLSCLNKGGRLVVISYHSLEDRIVKRMFRQWAASCSCPPDFPVCTCGKVSQVRRLTGKVVVPQVDEVERNPRSRSAKLRAVERL